MVLLGLDAESGSPRDSARLMVACGDLMPSARTSAAAAAATADDGVVRTSVSNGDQHTLLLAAGTLLLRDPPYYRYAAAGTCSFPPAAARSRPYALLLLSLSGTADNRQYLPAMQHAERASVQLRGAGRPASCLLLWAA